MDEMMLFTDGSVNTKSKIGYGAYQEEYNEAGRRLESLVWYT